VQAKYGIENKDSHRMDCAKVVFCNVCTLVQVSRAPNSSPKSSTLPRFFSLTGVKGQEWCDASELMRRARCECDLSRLLVEHGSHSALRTPH
jgi:hypothetical protein